MNEFEKQMMRKATSIMNTQPELKEQSKIRARYKFQKDLPFEGGAELSKDDLERRPCTLKEKEELDKSMEKLGDIFNGADFYWQLDGALNISLYRGEYIGVHKDIDISVDLLEIDKAESFLGKKGMGMFLSSGEQTDKGRVFERVGTGAIKNNTERWHVMIMAVDENGKIKHGGEGFGFDTHIIKRNEKGQPLGNNETPVPYEWLKPTIINFHGRDIRCSHPAMAAFHKLFFTRAYDDNDLKLLAESGMLSESDVDSIEATFNDHIRDMEKIIGEFLDRTFSKIHEGSDFEKIFEILINDEIVRRKDHPENQKFFRELAEEVLKNFSRKQISEYIFSKTPINELASQKEQRIAILRDNIPKK